MELSSLAITLAGALVSGLVGSACAWFVFARKLVTREEVEKMIHDRVSPVESRQTRTEDLIEGLRGDMQKLSENIVRLSTILESLRPQA